jgi:hypothetical protein
VGADGDGDESECQVGQRLQPIDGVRVEEVQARAPEQHAGEDLSRDTGKPDASSGCAEGHAGQQNDGQHEQRAGFAHQVEQRGHGEEATCCWNPVAPPPLAPVGH